MNYSTRRFALDLHKSQSQISIAAFRNDTAVKLSILITDGGSPYRFEEGVIAVLWGTKEDGKPISHACSIEESTRIIYEFNDTTTDDVGVIDCQIRFYKGGEQILSAPKFSIVVSERVGNYDEIESYEYEDGEYGKYFAQQFSSLDKIFTGESERITAENARVDAENVREENERIRVEKELARIESETQRQTNEAERVKAEEARVEAETKREEAYAQVDAKIEGKLDKTTLANRIYGTKSDKSQTAYLLDKNATANSVPQRTPTGQLRVQLAPENDNEATSKKYVIGLVNPLEERVSDLENLTLSYSEISSTDYEKSVPAEVGKSATIKMIGGATKKVSSNNLLNPMDIIKVEGRGGATVDYPFTVNGDSITFTVTQENLGANIYFDTSSLGTGKYYVLCELNSDATTNVNATLSGVFGFENEWWIEVAKPEGEQYPNWYPDEFTFNCKLAIYKAEDSDTLEFVEAPEGTVFEPYSIRFEIAEVSKVESLGANLIPFPYVYKGKTMDVGYTETVDGVTFEVLEQGLIKANGTATKTATFRMWQSEMPAGDYYVSGKYSKGGVVIGSYNNLANGCGQINTKFIHGGGLFGAGVRIESGVTVNSIFYPIITRNVYVDEFKPYKAEPIDSITIPEAVTLKAVNNTYYDYIEFIDDKVLKYSVVEEMVLNGTESWALASDGYFVLYGSYLPATPNSSAAVALCTHYDYGISKGKFFVSTGIGVYEKNCATVDEFKAYLAEQYANENPVTIMYVRQMPKVTDITDLFTEDNSIEVEGGGPLRFVNENKMAVPNTVGFVTRKG